MKILALSPIYYPHVGGAERTLKELFTRVAARGHCVDLVTPNWGGEAESAEGGLRIFRVGSLQHRRLAKFLLHQYWQLGKARQLMRQGHYDLGVLTYGAPAALVQVYLQRLCRLPIVIQEFHLGTGAEISSGDENPAYIKFILRHSYRAADGVIAISRDNARFIQEVSGRTDCVVIPQGTDCRRWHPANRSEELRLRFCPPSCLLLLTVSRLSPRKNLQAMLEAAALLRRQTQAFRLVIVGDGEERQALERYIQELDLGDLVHLTGFLDDDTVRCLYASADVYLSTSTYEGFGLSILEAMASGLPIVAYNAKGTDDYLVDGEMGFVTEHTPAQFASALERLVADAGLRQEMGALCRKKVVDYYNWDRYVDRHIEVFQEVVARRCTR